jgi:hypothetical protein
MSKHGATISDIHSGHKFGLCLPENWVPESNDPVKKKIRLWQMETYSWFKKKSQEVGHLDVLAVNGDGCEGDGIRSGATELWTSDRLEQAKAAVKLIRHFDFKKAIIIEGTNSHTGTAEQYEAPIAEALGTHIQAHAWLEHAGCVLDFKHHIGSSSVPGAVPPALGREAVWNLMWAEHELQPRAQIFFRSHLHTYHAIIEDEFTAIVTPALQGWTRYGGTRMSKTISYGFIEWWISDEGEFTWKRHRLIPTFAAAKAEAI